MIKFLLKNIWAIINIPAVLFFIYLVAFPEEWKDVIGPTGLIAFIFLVIVLSLNPLCKIFPKIRIFKEVNKHRRAIGVSVFVYAVVHVYAYYLKKGSLAAIAPYLVHPVIFPALIAFIILFVLTVTSNNYSVKKLGGGDWKKLHKLTYVGEGLIFLHMALQKGDVLDWALMGFIPLVLLQLRRWQIERAKAKG